MLFEQKVHNLFIKISLNTYKAITHMLIVIIKIHYFLIYYCFCYLSYSIFLSLEAFHIWPHVHGFIRVHWVVYGVMAVWSVLQVSGAQGSKVEITSKRRQYSTITCSYWTWQWYQTENFTHFCNCSVYCILYLEIVWVLQIISNLRQIFCEKVMVQNSQQNCGF